MKKFYIISLKHTNKTDAFITLWRPDNKGYCYALENAGEYDTPEPGYHDGDQELPVELSILKKLSISVPNDDTGLDQLRVPNIATIHKILGLKYFKGDMIKTSVAA